MSSAIESVISVTCLGDIFRKYIEESLSSRFADVTVREVRSECAPSRIGERMTFDVPKLRGSFNPYLTVLKKCCVGLGVKFPNMVILRSMAQELFLCFRRSFEDPKVFPGMIITVHFLAAPREIEIYYYCAPEI